MDDAFSHVRSFDTFEVPRMQPTIPDFDNEEWDSQRVALQDELCGVAVKLADHMSAPGGFKGKLEFRMDDGRTLYITLEAGQRPKSH